MWRKSARVGSYGASTGAASAMNTMPAATQPQNADIGERRAKVRSTRNTRQRPRRFGSARALLQGKDGVGLGDTHR